MHCQSLGLKVFDMSPMSMVHFISYRIEPVSIKVALCKCLELGFVYFFVQNDPFISYLRIGLPSNVMNCCICRYDYAGYGRSTGKVIWMFSLIECLYIFLKSFMHSRFCM